MRAGIGALILSFWARRIESRLRWGPLAMMFLTPFACFAGVLGDMFSYEKGVTVRDRDGNLPVPIRWRCCPAQQMSVCESWFPHLY